MKSNETDWGSAAGGNPMAILSPRAAQAKRGAEDLGCGEKPAGARKIEQSIDYMKCHLDEQMQVARLAETVHISPSHFFALFKRWAGYSPMDYFIRLRMRQACKLLASTSMNVKEVAADLGYDDPFYFSRLFKSVVGIPPTGYRLMVGRGEQVQSWWKVENGAGGVLMRNIGLSIQKTKSCGRFTQPNEESSP